MVKKVKFHLSSIKLYRDIQVTNNMPHKVGAEIYENIRSAQYNATDVIYLASWKY